MRYNRDLMMAILWDRMPYLTALLNTEVISLDQAPEAYKIFAWETAPSPSRPPRRKALRQTRHDAVPEEKKSARHVILAKNI
jgi:hypothetical protein